LESWRFGEIFHVVPKEIQQASTFKWKESKNPKVKPLENTNVQIITEKVSDIFQICDDFLDSITYEVMTCPMVLPCGKYIDQLTLDKCIEYDIMYGRIPNDPFTGIPFTDALKPMPVPELKGRIDSFLIKHADNESVKCVPRAVGKRSFSFYTERQTKISKVLCSICNEYSNLYCLPCKHIQCKNCIQSERILCNICHKNCNRNQIEKHHGNL